ncbi:hypothetical protein ACOME3_010813, partial [Neoechinorhynchus agilis]
PSQNEDKGDILNKQIKCSNTSFKPCKRTSPVNFCEIWNQPSHGSTYYLLAASYIAATEVMHYLSDALKGASSRASHLSCSSNCSSDTSIEFVPVRKSRKRSKNTR